MKLGVVVVAPPIFELQTFYSAVFMLLSSSATWSLNPGLIICGPAALSVGSCWSARPKKLSDLCALPWKSPNLFSKTKCNFSMTCKMQIFNKIESSPFRLSVSNWGQFLNHQYQVTTSASIWYNTMYFVL